MKFWRFLYKNNFTMAPTLLDEVLSSYPQSECVRILDPARVENLLLTMVKRGRESLQVITDFDATLSRYHKDGEKCVSSYGILACSPLVTETYNKAAVALFEKYHPIETNVEMTIEEKSPHMVEWYSVCHRNLQELSPPLLKSDMLKMAAAARCYLRDNANSMLKNLRDAEVPVLILSAGVGDLVEGVLNVNKVNFSNTTIISNFMQFNEMDELVGFKKPMIHTFNKNEAVLHDIHSKYFEDVKLRNNALVLGDNLGDAAMDHGISDKDAILKIGFLNSQIDKNLEAFMQTFDIVLLDDQSMDFVNLILKKILSND